MPEQPPDPIHYDMKIPPDTEHSKNEPGSHKPKSDHDESESETAKDTNVVRGDDKPQKVRPDNRT